MSLNYPIAIVGSSGSGKSYSLRNLDPASTAIINLERKPLPFKGGPNTATNQWLPTTAIEFERTLAEQLKRKEVKVIVIESLTKYLEKLLEMSRDINKGYDIYSFYNKRIGKLLELIKECTEKDQSPKYVVVLAIDELVKTALPSGAEVASRRIAVSGKEWEGKIEKEFTVVLFTDVKPNKDGKVSEYRFLTNNDGTHTAKSPPDMFKGAAIDNDVAAVIKSIEAFNAGN